MTDYATLEAQLAGAQAVVRTIEHEMKEARAEMTFKCGCGGEHKFKDVLCIQHYYRHGGDHYFSEYQLVCPFTGNKNRLHWPSRNQVEWSRRDHYEENAQTQFGRLYEGLFKETVKSYEGDPGEDKRSWWNNEMIDKKRISYGIRVKSLDDTHIECTCAKCRG